jgi:hypothetical protein
MVVHTCNPSSAWGIGKRITVKARPRQNHKTLSKKQLKRKGEEVTAQVAECLPSKCKALTSNLSTGRKKKGKNTTLREKFHHSLF